MLSADARPPRRSALRSCRHSRARALHAAVEQAAYSTQKAHKRAHLRPLRARQVRVPAYRCAYGAAGADRPLDFICGQGQTLEYFEMNLLDKNEGDKFDFSIPAAHAYGLVNEDMIVDLPQEIFKDVEAEEMVVGHVLPMMDSVGRRLQGKILSIGDEEVRIDFNHPLAGKDLFFKGEILGVRDATDEELEALHSHKCGGCSGCGSEGGCGSHDEGCGCGECH